MILFSIASTFLYARNYNTDNRILIGTGNDRFTMGISKNYDDYLSFSSFMDLQNGNLHIKTFLNGYTDRVEKTRRDEAVILGLWDLRFDGQYPFIFGIEASAGIDIDGKLGFSGFQNRLHKALHIATLDFSYPEKTTLRPYGDVKLSAEYSLLRDSKIGLFVEGLYWDEFGCNFGISYRFKRSYLQVGFDGHSLNLSTRMDMGLLVLSHETNLGNRHGFGTVSLDIMSLMREKTWRNSDVYVNLGYSFIRDFKFMMQQTVQTTDILPFNLTVFSRYYTGNPASSRLLPNQRVIRGHNQIAFGADYRFKELWIFNPYVELAAGIARWQMEIVYTDGSPGEQFKPIDTFFAVLRAGTNLIPEGTVVFDSASIMVNAAVELNYFFSSDRITDYIRKDIYHDSDYVFRPFCISFTIGVTFGLDLY